MAGCRRKNIGYLWAIEHGAKTVYETDDDNILKVDEPASMWGMDFYVYNSTGAPPCAPACLLILLSPGRVVLACKCLNVLRA